MLTKTSLTAIRLLIHLDQRRPGKAPATARQVASQIGESATYLVKVARLLAKAGLVRSQRGVSGGIRPNRRPADISLLEVVQACQGTILGDFCQQTQVLKRTCAFHQAGAELHAAITDVLSRWRLSDLLRKPAPSDASAHPDCWMQSHRFGHASRVARVQLGVKR